MMYVDKKKSVLDIIVILEIVLYEIQRQEMRLCELFRCASVVVTPDLFPPNTNTLLQIKAKMEQMTFKDKLLLQSYNHEDTQTL